MQDILKNFLSAGEAKMPVRECGDMDQGGVTLKTSSAGEMAEILRALSGIAAGEKPSMPPMDMDEPTNAPMPMKLPMVAPEEAVEEGGLKNMSISVREDLYDLAQEIQKGMHNYDAVVDELNDMFDNIKTAGDPVAINAFKTLRSLEPEDFGEGEGGGPNRASIVAQDAMDMIDGEDDSDYDHLEGYTNEPEEEYMDVDDVLPSGNDMHRKKPMAAMRVKDPAVATESIKDRLWAALNEKKSDLEEISSDMAKRYTKNAKVDRDNTDDILKRDGSTNDWKANQELQKRNAKRTKGINRAKKRM